MWFWTLQDIQNAVRTTIWCINDFVNPDELQLRVSHPINLHYGWLFKTSSMNMVLSESIIAIFAFSVSSQLLDPSWTSVYFSLTLKNIEAVNVQVCLWLDQPWKSTSIWRGFCYCNIWWIGFHWELICVDWEIGSFCTLLLMEWKITFAIARTAPLVGKQILLQRAGMHLRQCQGDSPNNGSLGWTGRL